MSWKAAKTPVLLPFPDYQQIQKNKQSQWMIG
jgi:hypothetical protein